MMKKRNIVLVLLLTISVLASCSGGSYTIKKGEINASENDLVGTYSSFTGHYFKKVKLEKDDVIKFNFTTNDVEGEISAKIINSDGEVLTKIEGEQTVTIKKADTYKFQVEGEKHESSFILSWEKE